MTETTPDVERAEHTVAHSETWQSYLVMQGHINGYGRLFGGMLMSWIDQVAGIVARRHAGCEATTAAVDSLVFHAPILVNDIVVLRGRVTHVGKSSMEVRVDSFREEADGTRHLVNRAYLVMVAIDSTGKSRPVPGLRLETEQERMEWETAARRDLLRRERRAEGY
ncbi:MAG: acyl-CoA thioesterase [Bacillota bacterium]|nr:acyl-CoA thioesterase [Bacillota bacterium]